jgi:hypothetical protein
MSASESDRRQGSAPQPETWELPGSASSRWGWPPSTASVLLVLLGLGFSILALSFNWHRWQQYQTRQLVQRHLVPHGVSPGYWRGDVVQLSFGRSQLTEEQSALLPRLPRLRRLVFLETELSPTALDFLPELGQLRELVFLDVTLTPSHVARIAECQGIRYLQMTNAGLKDSLLEPLGSVTELRRLDLNRNAIGDRGLRHLHGLQQLEQIFLGETQVSDEGLTELQRKIPRLVIRKEEG